MVKPIILAQFAASFLPFLQKLSSYLILGFTLIVSLWVTAITDAIMFYDHRLFGLEEVVRVQCILERPSEVCQATVLKAQLVFLWETPMASQSIL